MCTIAYPRTRCLLHVPSPDKFGRHCVMCKHCSIVDQHAKMPFGLSNSLSMELLFRKLILFIHLVSVPSVHAFLVEVFRLLFYISVQLNLTFFLIF